MIRETITCDICKKILTKKNVALTYDDDCTIDEDNRWHYQLQEGISHLCNNCFKEIGQAYLNNIEERR